MTSRVSSGEPTQANSISQRLAEFAFAQAYTPVNTEARAKARDLLVDVVGLCIAARNTDYVQAVVDARETGDQVLIGHRLQASASSAALINGTAAHGEDFDDTFEGGPVHSGAVVIPAMLSAAQSYHLSSDDLLRGIVASTEVLCRLALVVPKAVHKAGFHPTAVLGAFAATLGICAATRTDRKVTANALGIVGSMASGIIEYLGDGSWTKRMHPGWAAQSALRACALAMAGFNGPRWVFEGKHGAFSTFAPSVDPAIDKLFDGLGEHWVMNTITFKPYPCGTMVQPYIDCACVLRSKGIRPEMIDRIICKTAEGIVHRLWQPLAQKRSPQNAYAAKFSVPFGVALGLVRGQATLDDYSELAVHDASLLSVAGKVSYEIDPDNPYPAAYTGHVRLQLLDGSVEEVTQSHLRGGISAPLRRSEIDAKFMANATYGGLQEAESLLQRCNELFECEVDTVDIAQLFDAKP
jgi:2-methylcitrate dehydratase PrpD